MSLARTDAILVSRLCKSFGAATVLDDIDLSVSGGTIFALLGPNGAGKTTMVRILSTLIPADSGEFSVMGCDGREDQDGIRKVIGVTGQFSALDELMTGAENLKLMADLQHLERGKGKERIDELLERFDLAGAAKKPVSVYSGGMRRRLDLAMTLVGDPRVIFLDEPTTGLDPRSRRTMWEIIRELAAYEVTIFLTTQYLDEADKLADWIAVLDSGRIVAEGTPDDLKSRVPGGHVSLEFGASSALLAAAEIVNGSTLDADKLVLHVPSDGSVASLRCMLNALGDAELEVEKLSIHTHDLDDVFFAVTGHQAQETTVS